MLKESKKRANKEKRIVKRDAVGQEADTIVYLLLYAVHNLYENVARLIQLFLPEPNNANN